MSVEQLGFLGNNGFIKSLGCASKLLETDALNLVTDLFEKEYGCLMRSVFEKKQDQSAIVEFRERVAALDLMRKKIQDAPIDKIKGFLSSGSNNLIDSINKDVAGVIDSNMDVKIDEEFIQDGFTEEFFNKRFGYRLIGISDGILGLKLDVGLCSSEFYSVRKSIKAIFGKSLFFKIVAVKNGVFKRIVPNINKTKHHYSTPTSASDLVKNGLVTICGPDYGHFHFYYLKSLIDSGWAVYVCFCRNGRSFLHDKKSFYFHTYTHGVYFMSSSYSVIHNFGLDLKNSDPLSSRGIKFRVSSDVYDVYGERLSFHLNNSLVCLDYSGGGSFNFGRSVSKNEVEKMHPGILDRSDIFLCKVSTL